MEMSLHLSLPLVPFEKCEIDDVGDVHPHYLKDMAYIMVATDYLTKWAEVKAVKTNIATHVATFMYKNFIFRFDCPKILVINRGIYFLNSLIKKT